MHAIRWNKVKGDRVLLLKHDLNENSVVFDIGGFEGEFTQWIIDKYNCNVFCFEPVKSFFDVISKRFAETEKVFVYNCAVLDSGKSGFIYENKDCSSIFLTEGKKQRISIIPFWEAMRIANVKKVDLLKINIEGGEYPLLASMLIHKQVEKCDNIQVQFHKIGEYLKKYNWIKEGLEKTHHLTYRYPFVWENWKIN